MIELIDRYPLVLFHFEHGVYQLTTLLADIVQLHPHSPNKKPFKLVECAILHERRFPRQHFNKDITQRPHITLVAVLVVQQRLRRHVCWRTDQHPFLNNPRAKIMTQADVSNLNFRVVDKYVGTFQIPVQNLLVVEVFQSHYQLLQQP